MLKMKENVSMIADLHRNNIKVVSNNLVFNSVLYSIASDLQDDNKLKICYAISGDFSKQY